MKTLLSNDSEVTNALLLSLNITSSNHMVPPEFGLDLSCQIKDILFLIWLVSLERQHHLITRCEKSGYILLR